MTERKNTDDDDRQRLLIMRAGGRRFAVDAKSVVGEADDFETARPAPLPGAPAAVLGVVQARGKIYTLIDPALMIAEPASNLSPSTNTPLVVPLRGGEQLALAVERIEGSLEVSLANIESCEPPLPAIAGIARDERTNELILVLDHASLFAAATRGMERRRRRS